MDCTWTFIREAGLPCQMHTRSYSTSGPPSTHLTLHVEATPELRSASTSSFSTTKRSSCPRTNRWSRTLVRGIVVLAKGSAAVARSAISTGGTTTVWSMDDKDTIGRTGTTGMREAASGVVAMQGMVAGTDVAGERTMVAAARIRAAILPMVGVNTKDHHRL